jgi:uncharacterized protein YjaG (DUF416 family)
LARSERYRDAWEASGKCDGSINPPPPLSAPALLSTAESTKAGGVTVERAVKAFLAEYLDSAASNTYKKYSIMMNKLKAYSTAKGYVMIDQWAPLDVREFRQAWDVSPITAAKNMSIVKTFFEFALCNEWITRNPGRLVKNRVSARATIRGPRSGFRSATTNSSGCSRPARLSMANVRSSGPERSTTSRPLQVRTPNIVRVVVYDGIKASDDASGQMTFKEFLPRLDQDLRSMSARHCLAFSAACCERAVANFEMYAREMPTLDSSAVRQTLDEVWEFIGGRRDALDVVVLQTACEQQLPPSSDNHPLVSAAADAIQMLDLLLNEAATPRPEISCQIAGWAVASIDCYLQVGPSPVGDLDKIATAELMQQELLRQSSDLDFLKRESILDAAKVSHLRSKAQATGSSLVSDSS